MVGRALGLAFLAATTATVRAAAQQKPAAMPAGVTEQSIKEGEGIFKGAGLCSVCHGPDAKGLPNLGVDLTDDKWLHSKGTYDEIVKQVTTGVTAEQSTSGTMMPPKGGSAITDAQVKAVAAYVWSLSHPAKK